MHGNISNGKIVIDFLKKIYKSLIFIVDISCDVLLLICWA